MREDGYTTISLPKSARDEIQQIIRLRVQRQLKAEAELELPSMAAIVVEAVSQLLARELSKK